MCFFAVIVVIVVVILFYCFLFKSVKYIELVKFGILSPHFYKFINV